MKGNTCILVHNYDLQMLTGDISLSCDEFMYATLGKGSHEGIQLLDKYKDKERELTDACRQLHNALVKIEHILGYEI